jgi:hypothetical protein
VSTQQQTTVPTPTLMPAPVKPRIRVRAVPGQAEEAAPKAVTPPAPAELPLMSTQAEYDKLPIGSRFRHPDGFVYRKHSESSEQKMQESGVVQPIIDPGKLRAAQATEDTTQDTDIVPAQLTPGEYVVPKPAVDQIGVPTLDALSGIGAQTPQQTQWPDFLTNFLSRFSPVLPQRGAPSGGGPSGGGAGGKSDVHGAVYEQYGWEGHAANYGPKGNRLGEGYGVGLGVDKQKESGAKFGDWVRVDFCDGTSVVRQVNVTVKDLTV